MKKNLLFRPIYILTVLQKVFEKLKVNGMWHSDAKFVIYKQPLNAPVSREEKAPVYSQTKLF